MSTLEGFAQRTGLTLMTGPPDVAVTGAYVVGADGNLLDGQPESPLTEVAVLDWSPSTEGQSRQPLELVIARIQHRCQSPAIAVLTQGGDAHPARQMLKAVEKRGLGLLWSATLSVAEVLSGAVDVDLAEQPTPARNGRIGIIEVLAGQTNLRSLTDGCAQLLGAAIGVYESGSLRSSAGEYSEDSTVAVAELRLEHAGNILGHVSVQRAEPLSLQEHTTLAALAGVFVLALRTESAERAQRGPAQAQLALMLGDDLQAREAALRRSRRLRLFPPRRMTVAVIEPFADQLGPAGLNRLADQLEPPLRLSDQRAVIVVHEGSLVVLLEAATDIDVALRTFRRAVSIPLTVGVGRQFEQMRRVAGAHREARRAVAIGRRMGSANQVTRYENLGLFRLLYQLPEHERRAYVTEVLGTVADRTPEAADNRRVLRALAAAHWNLTEAAASLFVHRNTLRSKLLRLEPILGPFIHDATVRLTLQVALDLHRLDEDSD